jgi:hypothetical protein
VIVTMELQISDEMNTHAQISPMTEIRVPEMISPRKTMLVLNRDEVHLNSISNEFKELKMVDCYPNAGRPRMDRLKCGGKTDFKCLKIESGRLRTLQIGDGQNARWLRHVRRLKNHQKSFQKMLQGVKIVPNQSVSTKPFGNFLNCKPVIVNRSITPKRSITPMRPRMYKGDDFLSPYRTLSRRVTFNLHKLPGGGGGANEDSVTTGHSMHTTSTRHSTVSCDLTGDVKALMSSLSTHKSHSLHRCVPVKTKILHKRKFERLFWSESDIQKSTTKSMRRARVFQSENPATVQQLSRIFMDTCSQSQRTEEHCDDDEEDQEEMLRNFLRDWAASKVRGLEDMVTGRDLFKETRTMSVQSVLAYQQTLRDTMCATTIDRMADLLRARSESTSHRARMFAMYLALGDAIVANSNEECNFLQDDRSIDVVQCK